MDPFHYTLNEEDEFFTGERCHIVELLNAKISPEQSIARARVEPGITTTWHLLRDTSEVYLILKGEGRLELNDGDEAFELKVGDTFRIPPTTAQRIKNTGDVDLIFLCICCPAFTEDIYELLE